MPTQSVTNCPACGGAIVEPGTIASFGPVMFGPEKKGFGRVEGLAARACRGCGHVSLLLKVGRRGCGRQGQLGDPTAGHPPLGQIGTTTGVLPAQTWGPGKFGGGLACGPANASAGCEIDTGWDNVVGEGVDVTI